MVKQYRKKPVVVEAVKWTGENFDDLKTFAPGDIKRLGRLGGVNLFVRTLEGPMTANIGDYIIKGVKGEFYPCKPDVFQATYEEVTQ